MKIAYIIPSLINKGPIVVVNNLVRFLKDRVDQIDVFYFDSLDSMDFACQTYQITMDTPINFDLYDIIHSNCFRPDKYVFKWRNKIKRAKIITTLHQDTYKSFRYQYNVVLSCLFTEYWCFMQKGFDGVISISNQLREQYNNKMNNKIFTIYNGCFVDINTADVDLNFKKTIDCLKKQKYKILGTYAYVTKRKGISQVLEILPKMEEYMLIIIGEGPDIPRLKKLVERLSITDRVLFFPYMKAPYNYLQFFDVYTMTSYSEGFGLAMVEAALAKKAIVCSDIPSFHEIFSDEEASFFELDNSLSLIRAIEQAYENRYDKGELIYKRAQSCFTAEKMAENHLDYYKAIL